MRSHALLALTMSALCMLACSRPDGYCANSCRGEANPQACYDECIKSGDGGVEDLDEEDPAVDLEDDVADPADDLVSKSEKGPESSTLDDRPRSAGLVIPLGR